MERQCILVQLVARTTLSSPNDLEREIVIFHLQFPFKFSFFLVQNCHVPFHVAGSHLHRRTVQIEELGQCLTKVIDHHIHAFSFYQREFFLLFLFSFKPCSKFLLLIRVTDLQLNTYLVL